MSSFSMLRSYRRESKTKPTKNIIFPSTLAFNTHQSNPTGLTEDLFLGGGRGDNHFRRQNRLKNKWSSKKQKKRFSVSPVPSASLVVWVSFFQTALFLVNENLVPLSIGGHKFVDPLTTKVSFALSC